MATVSAQSTINIVMTDHRFAERAAALAHRIGTLPA